MTSRARRSIATVLHVWRGSVSRVHQTVTRNPQRAPDGNLDRQQNERTHERREAEGRNGLIGESVGANGSAEHEQNQGERREAYVNRAGVGSRWSLPGETRVR